MSFLDQGLNFSIHADAAWGAYFASMLQDPPAGLSKQNVEDEGFVPELSLNEFVIKQMEVFLTIYPLNPNIKIKILIWFKCTW